MSPNAPLTSYVDPFIGTAGRGNCLCGPYLPLSLVRLGPDTAPPQPTSGYQDDRPITGFSHTHVSGTGGDARYGNIAMMPFTGVARAHLDPADKEDERAAAGYYAVTLQPSGIRVELTSSPRVGVHCYRYPAGGEAHVRVDLASVVQTHHLQPTVRNGGPIGAFAEVLSPRELAGRADFRGGWGHKAPYSIYFYARFDRDCDSHLVANEHGLSKAKLIDGVNCCVVFSFGEIAEVNLQVGISHVSIGHARASLEREAAGNSFEQVRACAVATWEEALSRIQVEGAGKDDLTLFYTGFTRLIGMPSDLSVNDEFPLWRSGVRHFSDFYCLWDSVRNANSLIGLFDPDLETAFLNCLLDVGTHTGWMPDAWIAGHRAMVQGGSSADILLCEAALKGMSGIDYEKALSQMRKNNEVESSDPFLHGRYLPEYRDKGYLSTNVPQSVSRTLEYGYQDWCIGRLAQHLGQREVAGRYFASSRKVWNLWRDDLKCFAPRRPDGTWQDPLDVNLYYGGSELWKHYYEGTATEWSFNVQHDYAGLVARHGGPEAFVAHLDGYFDAGRHRSKETILHVPYLYLYAGRPDLASRRVRESLRRFFHRRRDGLHDNEDMGCQSAFFMCAAMGIYPLMGQDLYWLNAPIFTRSEIALGRTGKSLVIEAPGADRGENVYIVGATLNGAPFNRAWIRHAEIADGATLRFDLADTPGNWAAHNPPPSPLESLG